LNEIETYKDIIYGREEEEKGKKVVLTRGFLRRFVAISQNNQHSGNRMQANQPR
jgi:hypothetical protein